VDWDEACERVASLLRGAGGSAVALVSPRASTEALFLARALLANFEWTGAFQLVMGDVAPLAGVPNLALRAERAPNVTGAELLGYTRAYAPALAAAERAGVVLVLDDPEVAVRPAGSLIYLGTVLPDDGGAALRSADVVLPIANVAEEDGTFVNRDGRVQRYCQAKAAPGMAQPAWWVLGELLARLERGSRVTSAAEAFDRLAREVEGLQGLSYATLGWEGQRVSGVVEVPA
jgi:NADH dehydrogenase/NADH:ubiquinone oxidoreductase subunit G